MYRKIVTLRARFVMRTKTTTSFDWSINGEEARILTRETRRKILHTQLNRRGLEILRPIGRGTFGRVVLVREKTKKNSLDKFTKRNRSYTTTGKRDAETRTTVCCKDTTYCRE